MSYLNVSVVSGRKNLYLFTSLMAMNHDKVLPEGESGEWQAKLLPLHVTHGCEALLITTRSYLKVSMVRGP
jgi:hypothetical protein